MNNFTLITLLFTLFCFLGKANSQNNKESKNDTLYTYSYNQLSEKYDSNLKDSILARIYANSFLEKAKKDKNIYKKADAYYMIAKLYKNSIGLAYADSIIEITKEKDNYIYPAKAYLLKSNILGSKGDYQKSMDESVLANQYAIKNKNIDQQFKTKYQIAILKNNLNEFEESLNILRSIVAYYKTKFDQNNKYEYDYIKSLYAYGNAFNVNEKYDSTLIINRKATRLSLKSQDSTLYGRLLLTSAVAHYGKKEYQAALDSIYKLKEINKYRVQSKGTIVRIDLFLGRIYFEQKNFEEAIKHLSKVDSFSFSNQYFFPSMVEAYELLIKHYKEQDNKDKQLYYIDKLLVIDSILDNDYKYLSRQINEKYSTPNLLAEKQQIIQSLQKNNKTKITIVIILSITTVSLILLLLWNVRKKKIYKKRFLELLKGNHKVAYKVKTEKEKEENKPKDIGISEEIVNDILNKLERFEKNEDFLKSNITIHLLSKEFKTNSKYLSKVINVHKNKGFSSYINDLRINYAVEKLKSDPKIRKYTIKAIANDIGFNTTEAFSKSFFKSTGIYPSFFLKQLEKEFHNLET